MQWCLLFCLTKVSLVGDWQLRSTTTRMLRLALTCVALQ
jgi:hypothetical protein